MTVIIPNSLEHSNLQNIFLCDKDIRDYIILYMWCYYSHNYYVLITAYKCDQLYLNLEQSYRFLFIDFFAVLSVI